MRYRELYFYKGYFEEFYEKQTEKVQRKIVYTLRLLQELEVIPAQYLKHLEGTKGLYEVRVVHGRNAFRIFCFFDAGNFIVLTSAFRKKTRKTPQRELLRAIKIKEDYEKERAQKSH